MQNYTSLATFKRYSSVAQRKLVVHTALLTLGCACMAQSACCHKCTPYCHTCGDISVVHEVSESATSENLSCHCIPTLLFGHVIANEKMLSFYPNKFFTEAVIFG